MVRTTRVRVASPVSSANNSGAAPSRSGSCGVVDSVEAAAARQAGAHADGMRRMAVKRKSRFMVAPELILRTGVPFAEFVLVAASSSEWTAHKTIHSLALA